MFKHSHIVPFCVHFPSVIVSNGVIYQLKGIGICCRNNLQAPLCFAHENEGLFSAYVLVSAEISTPSLF